MEFPWFTKIVGFCEFSKVFSTCFLRILQMFPVRVKWVLKTFHNATAAPQRCQHGDPSHDKPKISDRQLPNKNLYRVVIERSAYKNPAWLPPVGEKPEMRCDVVCSVRRAP